MPEPKPELEAVARMCRRLYTNGAVGHWDLRFDEPPDGPLWETMELADLPAAQALLAERDERIEELEDRIAAMEDVLESLESSRRSLSEMLYELESKLAGDGGGS